jgi:hypothetical protein
MVAILFVRDDSHHGCHGWLSWMVVMDGCHGWLSRIVVMDGCHGWMSWMVVMDGCHGWLSWMVVIAVVRDVGHLDGHRW